MSKLNASELLRTALSFLGSRHKERVGLGILIGLFFYWLFSILVAINLFPEIGLAASIVGPMAIGLIIPLLPLFRSQDIVPEKDKYLFNIIDEAVKRGHLSNAQKKLIYNNLLHKLIERYVPGESLDVEKLADEVIAENSTDG